MICPAPAIKSASTDPHAEILPLTSMGQKTVANSQDLIESVMVFGAFLKASAPEVMVRCEYQASV